MAEVCLHLGPHKTATTHIQDTLALFRPEMAVAGLFYLPITATRNTISSPLQACQRHQATLAGRLLKMGKLEASIAASLRNLPGQGRDVLLSDERLLGEPDECLSGQLYPTALPRLQRLARLLPAPVSQVYLCVRDYAPLLSSLFIESLRWGARVEPEQLVAAYRAPTRQWSALVNTVLEAFPKAQLHLWQFEDFTHLRAEVLALLSRVPGNVIGRSPDRIVRPAMSVAAVAEILRTFPHARTYADRQFAALLAQGRNPRHASEAAFDPWPADLRAAMSAMYADEIGEWLANPRITFLRAQAGEG